MSGRSILIVDDDPGLLISLKMVFTARGYTANVAQDGTSALAQIHRHLPDILLSDLYMPGMNGFELLAVVTRKYPQIHTIAMCAIFPDNPFPEDVIAHGFYRKAEGLDKLFAIVDSMCDRLDRCAAESICAHDRF